jgi:hypothetical protein
MKLNELGKYSSSALNKKMEQKFGFKLRTESLDQARARKLLSRVEENINAFIAKNGNLLSERSAQYTELMMMRDGLTRWLGEQARQQLGRNRILAEGEVEQAQTVLAAKDIVDRLQKMLEDVSAMQAEELPPLLDSIRDQMGADQAAAYNSTVSSALSGLLELVKQTRETVDTATRTIAGEQTAPVMAPETPVAPEAPEDLEEPEEMPDQDVTQDIGRELR